MIIVTAGKKGKTDIQWLHVVVIISLHMKYVTINAKMTEGRAGVALAYWAGSGFDSRLCQFFPIRCCFQVIFALDVFMCKFSDDTNFTWSISGKEIFCHFYVAWYKVFNALTPVCT